VIYSNSASTSELFIPTFVIALFCAYSSGLLHKNTYIIYTCIYSNSLYCIIIILANLCDCQLPHVGLFFFPTLGQLFSIEDQKIFFLFNVGVEFNVIVASSSLGIYKNFTS